MITETRNPTSPRNPTNPRVISELRNPASRRSDQLARQLVTGTLRRLAHGSLEIVESDGRRHEFGAGSPRATMTFHSDTVWSAFLRGGRGLAAAYIDERWDSPDLAELVGVAAANIGALDRPRRLLTPARVLLERVREYRGAHSLSTSREDIAAHYDLGNELFELMLDPSLTYSSAYFEHAEDDLETAQTAKLELICDQLQINSADHVLEIGSGWGSFALHAAKTRGCKVTTTTISAEQYAYVRAAVDAAGLQDQITVLERDYRELEGSFDKLVSIEMIEAVGWRDLGRFVGCCSALLKADGAMLLQAITTDDRAYLVERSSRSFITEYIFPGGSLPSLQALSAALAKHTDFQIASIRDLTAHYVQTLRLWRLRFSANADLLASRGYDERFQRLWRLYLAYSEGGFAQRRINDLQILLVKPRYRSSLPA